MQNSKFIISLTAIIAVLIVAAAAVLFFVPAKETPSNGTATTSTKATSTGTTSTGTTPTTPNGTVGTTPTSENPLMIPIKKTLAGGAHVWQTFNNCSSTGLMIALSFLGITDTQEAIAEATRPWNNRQGDNDDKSVTLFELEKYAKEKYGLATYVRPNGDLEMVKKLIANDIPVIARALMYPDKDYVHYRVIKGYDDETKTIIESDSIEGSAVPYSYTAWLHLWKDFNYSYLVVVPTSKKALVEEILGEDLNATTAWQHAKARAEGELAKNPSDVRAHYNLVTALYYLGDYAGTVREFEKIENSIQPHVLWFQMEPIEAYYKLGNYDRVISLTDNITSHNNKAVSELYILKGKIYQSRGDLAAAKAEFAKAVMYNKNLKEAQDAYASVASQ